MSPRLESDKNWIVYEDDINRGKMRFWETMFTLGNGYLGSRGILEEDYEEGYAGTYIAGVYDRGAGQSFELVNAPNPLNLGIYVNNKKLSADDMDIIEHHRILDIRRAVLSRRTVFLSDGGRYEYESRRFFSLRDMHTSVMAFSFRSLDSDACVIVRRSIDGATRNEIQALGNPIKHYAVTYTSNLESGVIYLEAKTGDIGIVIGMASASSVNEWKPEADAEIKYRTDKESVVREVSFNARKGKRYNFNEYISVYLTRT
jgi:trehalose/maltose hydrolase-like predicted phosphorylase